MLGDAEATLFEAAYDVTDAGNWEGRTILRRVRDDTSLAVELERPRDEIAEALTRARVRLLRQRDERPAAGAGRQGADGLERPRDRRLRRRGPRARGARPSSRWPAEAADFVLRESAHAGRPAAALMEGRPRAPRRASSRTTPTSRTGCWRSTRRRSTSAGSAPRASSPSSCWRTSRADDGGFYDTADDAEALIARPASLQDNALPSGGAMATHGAPAAGRADRRGPLPRGSRAGAGADGRRRRAASHRLRAVAPRLPARQRAHRRGRHRGRCRRPRTRAPCWTAATRAVPAEPGRRRLARTRTTRPSRSCTAAPGSTARRPPTSAAAFACQRPVTDPADLASAARHGGDRGPVA